MSFTSVFMVLAMVAVAITLAEEMIDPAFQGNDSEKTRQGTHEILFPSGEDGMGTNGTNEAGNTTIDDGSGGAPVPSKSLDDHKEHPPIRFGQWSILGCHNDDETWGCELRRLLFASSYGFIDTLKFTVRKDKSLKVANGKEACDSCGGGRSFRIVVQCPKIDRGCNEEALRRVKVVNFQAGFLCAIVIMLSSMLLCACLCNALGRKKRGSQPTSVMLFSKNAAPRKW